MSTDDKTDIKLEAAKIEPLLTLDLSFAPDWARKPSKLGAPKITSATETDATQDRRGRTDRNSRGDKGNDRGADNRGRVLPRRPQASRPRPAPIGNPVEYVPVPRFTLRILPTSKALASIVRQIRSARKAYPLRRLALLLLSNPDHCFAKLELDQDSANPPLFQCSACQTIALTKAMLTAHVLKSHFNDYFLVEETECEAPSGLFVCVAKCKRTGVLLGPPNHHSYTERVEETRRSHFPDMPYETYIKGIETLRDPAMIEQWKEQSRKQTLYRLKNSDGTTTAEPMRWGAAVAHISEQVAPTLVSEVRKANVPMGVAIKIGDQQLEPGFKNALMQETRAPRSMTLALRMAFRHMHLYVFRTSKWGDLVSAVSPCQMDWEHAVESIRRIYSYLSENPGSKPEAISAALQTADPASSTSTDEATKSLRWLVEKGHIIELFDGALIIPHFIADTKKQPVKADASGGPRPAAPVKENAIPGPDIPAATQAPEAPLA